MLSDSQQRRLQQIHHQPHVDGPRGGAQTRRPERGLPKDSARHCDTVIEAALALALLSLVLNDIGAAAAAAALAVVALAARQHRFPSQHYPWARLLTYLAHRHGRAWDD